MSIRDGIRPGAFAAVVALAAASLACSFSYSSKSISDSITSSSKSISDSVTSSSDSVSDSSTSSSPGSAASRYRKDVESYTQAFVVSGGSDSSFKSGLGEVAKKHGITDWEANDETWIGIGRGLGRTKIDDVQLGVYQKNWTGGDVNKIKLIQQGFDAVR